MYCAVGHVSVYTCPVRSPHACVSPGAAERVHNGADLLSVFLLGGAGHGRLHGLEGRQGGHTREEGEDSVSLCLYVVVEALLGKGGEGRKSQQCGEEQAECRFCAPVLCRVVVNISMTFFYVSSVCVPLCMCVSVCVLWAVCGELAQGGGSPGLSSQVTGRTGVLHFLQHDMYTIVTITSK